MDLRKSSNIVRRALPTGGFLTIRDSFLDVDYVWYQADTDECATKAPVKYDIDQKPYFEIGNEQYYIGDFR